MKLHTALDPRQAQTLASFYENQALLERYYLPADLERRIGEFVEYYNHKRYHESLTNLTPAAAFFYGRGQQILNTKEKIKLGTLTLHKQMYYCKPLQYNLMT